MMLNFVCKLFCFPYVEKVAELYYPGYIIFESRKYPK